MQPSPQKTIGLGEKTAQDSDGGGAPTPVHGLIVPVLLSVSSSSGHMRAPHNCLQSLHKVFAELALQRRNTLAQSPPPPSPWARSRSGGGAASTPLTPIGGPAHLGLAGGPTGSKPTLQEGPFLNRTIKVSVSVGKKQHRGQNRASFTLQKGTLQGSIT